MEFLSYMITGVSIVSLLGGFSAIALKFGSPK